jgi:hypothetical protein
MVPLYVPLGSPAAQSVYTHGSPVTHVHVEPILRPRQVRSAEVCACEAGETMDPFRFSFVLDDLDATDVEEVHVPMVEDFVDWRCRVRFV